MKKSILKKIFITLLISVIFVAMCVTNDVQATCTEESNLNFVAYSVQEAGTEETDNDIDESLVIEEKIMKYDARTNQTTEVNMEELEQVKALLNTRSENGSYSLEAYDPYESVYTDFISTFSVRMKVHDTSTFPYRATCKLLFNNSEGNTYGGSGALVGDNLLLTAAHCVFDPDNDNAKYLNWVAYPAYNNGIYNNLSSGWSQVYYSNSWMSGHSYQYDWALCVLENDIGASVGYMGTQVYGTSSEMVDLEVATLGYPIDGDENNQALYQYKTPGTISSCSTNWFKYTGVISGGMSGGPILRASDNLIVGVTSQQYTYQDAGRGWRLTQSVLELIASLR